MESSKSPVESSNSPKYSPMRYQIQKVLNGATNVQKSSVESNDKFNKFQ